MGNATLLVTCPQMQTRIGNYRELLDARGVVFDTPPVQQQMEEHELIPIIGRYDGMIAGDDRLNARVLSKAVRLKVISKWGVGVDNIDTTEARNRNIKVLNTPGVFNEEVADVCIGYLIMLSRGLHLIDAAVRSGGWKKIEGVSLPGKIMGIVGLGGIGRALARRATAMGLTIIGCEPDQGARGSAQAMGVEVVDLPALCARSDIISLNCPLTPETHHMFDKHIFRSLKRGVLLINASRGGLIDEAALVEALAENRVGGAALDVFEVEPLPLDHELREFSTCILGSHNASNAKEAVDRTSALALENVLSVLAPE